MNNCPCENYAKQADEIQPKAKAPRPKKEVAKKPDPKKIFEGGKDSTPAKAAPKRRKRRRKKPYPT
jgi:hypothetical protein